MRAPPAPRSVLLSPRLPCRSPQVHSFGPALARHSLIDRHCTDNLALATWRGRPELTPKRPSARQPHLSRTLASSLQSLSDPAESDRPGRAVRACEARTRSRPPLWGREREARPSPIPPYAITL